jgi:hypothetical protein
LFTLHIAIIKKAYEKYSQHYLASNGQVYWNDLIPNSLIKGG